MRKLMLLAALLFLTSCVYYNTFYNARQSFKRAESNQKRSKTTAASQYSWDKNRAAPPEEPSISMNERNLYKEAIDRANKVLVNYPNSKYVDDALWLIGKSRYNMGEYVAAESRLDELVQNFPKSKYVDEAIYHIGLCRYWMKSYLGATLSFGTIVEKKKSPLKDDAAFMIAYLEFIQKKYPQALTAFENFVKDYPKSDSAATAQFFIGACYDSLRQPLAALKAYRKVREFEPKSDIYFDASYAFGLAAFKADSVNAAVEAFRNLAAQERYFERSGIIRLQLARGKYLQGQVDQAIDEYSKIIEQFPNSAQSAEAYYQLGLIYMDRNDLTKAKENLTKSSKEGPNQQIKRMASARLAQLTKYETYLTKLGQIPKSDSIGQSTQSAGADTIGVPKTPSDSTGILVAHDSTTVDSTENLDIIDSLTGAHPLEVAMAESAAIASDTSIEETASVRFLLAELFYYELERPDSAINEYLLLADQYPLSSYAPRALLAVSLIYLERGDSLSAKKTCRRIIQDYPSSAQARYVKKQFSELWPTDILDAEAYYRSAESLYFAAADTDSALAIFRFIEDTFPNDEYAAKSAFAAAWIKSQNLIDDGDSSAYRAFAQMAEKYANTIYAQRAKILLGLAVDSSRIAAPPEPPKLESGQDTTTIAEADTVTEIPGLPWAPPPKDTGEFIYPEHLLSQKLRGRVTFKIKLDFIGKVIDYQMIGPSGNAAIDSAAIRALTQTVFDISYVDDLTKLNDYFRYDLKFAPPKIDEFYHPYQERREKGP